MTTLLDPRVGQRSLPLADIVRDPGLQPREALDDDTIERYADAMAAGAQFPAVIVYFDGSVYWLADGSHRCAAADRLQRASIDAEIYRGARHDALLHALRANTEHGLQRRPGDLRRAVELALDDPEISRESDRQIALFCHCSHTYVSQIRKARSGNSLQIEQTHRLVRRGEQVFEQAVRPTEADIAIARDLVAEALGTWSRPANRGSIYNQVQRLDGGARMPRQAVYLALDRMIEAGNVLDLQDEHGRRVHALAHDPAIKLDGADEATSPAEDELNAQFDRAAIVLLGRTDDGAEHRAVDVARKLVAAGLWDGQTRIEFDAYALHDKLFGVAPISPLDLVEGQDTLFFPGRPRDLENRILGLLTASPLPAAIVCERLHMADTADQRRAVHLALDELRRNQRIREYRSMWFIEREKTGHTGDLYKIVKAAQPDAPEPEREEVPEGSVEWQMAMAEDDARRQQTEAEVETPDDELAGDCTGDYEAKPDPADQKLPTPTAKDADKVRDLLKRHASLSLRMKYIREQLDMGDSDFYRARMLLLGGGEVVQDGESLRLVAKPATPAPAPEPEPVVPWPAETPDAATQLAQIFFDLRAALERLQAFDATSLSPISPASRAALHEQQSALLALFGAALLHLDGDEGDAAE